MEILQVLAFFIFLILSANPLGVYMAKVFTGEKNILSPIFHPFENTLLRLLGVDAGDEMNWRQYTVALLILNGIGILFLFLLQTIQSLLPFNPQHLKAVDPLLAFNTAISFVTNTNWQAYSGESTMSYFTQMLGLTVQNFLSAATGLAVVIALVRGLTRRSAQTIGSFWVDTVRSVVWVLLPISILLALVLCAQGVVQTLSPYIDVTTLEGARQHIAVGPVASQEAIKELGTNGGGFFNANSAHPFENPTPLTNFLEMFALLIIPFALPFTFGRMVGNVREGRAIFAAMFMLLIATFAITYSAEIAGNPQIHAIGVQSPTAMEGKEVRFGVVNSALWASITTATSCGAVNAMHDSFTPLGGLPLLLQMMLGEVVFGGVGSGLYAMLIFVILTVFIVGLMVGRTPEYLGKKIESYEMKMAVLAVLIPSITILGMSALASITRVGTSSILNPGPHGLSEMLYAFSSAAGNNGSAFAGLTANTTFYNLMTGFGMLLGRFGVIVPVLAIAGSLGQKKTIAVSAGTFQTASPLFVGLLIGVILIIGVLTFFPALALGPIVEQFLMHAGKVF